MTSQYFCKLFIPLFLLCMPIHAESKSLTQAEAIFAILKPNILDFDIDAILDNQQPVQILPISEDDKLNLISKLANIIEQELFIEFLFPAFPFKSGNHDQNTISNNVDMAEHKSFEHLNQMIEAIKKIYPNIHFIIVTDGLLFADLFHISDETVLEYEQELKELATLFPHITITPISQLLLEKNESLQIIREEIGCIEKIHSISHLKNKKSFKILKTRVLQEINHPNHPYFHMQPFDQVIYLEKIAQAVIDRDTFVKKFMKQFETENTIRLSTHYQKNISEKIGIKFLNDSQVTPWNGVFVQKADGTGSIVRKRDIDTNKCKLENAKHAFYNWR